VLDTFVKTKDSLPHEISVHPGIIVAEVYQPLMPLTRQPIAVQFHARRRYIALKGLDIQMSLKEYSTIRSPVSQVPIANQEQGASKGRDYVLRDSSVKRDQMFLCQLILGILQKEKEISSQQRALQVLLPQIHQWTPVWNALKDTSVKRLRHMNPLHALLDTTEPKKMAFPVSHVHKEHTQMWKH
jgi:hypothetical protein